MGARRDRGAIKNLPLPEYSLCDNKAHVEAGTRCVAAFLRDSSLAQL
jgi:hypothetical protein